jgi:predicted signal transduction protein with EAL and GGDEF domain
MLGNTNSDEVIGKEIAELFHPDYYEIFSENLVSLVVEDMMFPTRIVRANDFYIYVEVGLSTIDISGSHLMIEARDITDHNQAVEALYQVNKNLEQRDEEMLRHLASHDVLTGLPNRGLLMDRISTALARGRREKSRYALFFIDLDGFRAVNDTRGSRGRGLFNDRCGTPGFQPYS